MNRKRLSSILFNTLLMVLLIACFVLATRGQAAEPALPLAQESTQAQAGTANIQPSNYCVSCHTAGDERLLHATEWRGGISVTQYTDCPAYKRIQEELYYTERLLLMIDRTQSGQTLSPALASRLQAGQEGYLRLLDQPVTSLEAFVAEAQSQRFKLGKVYNELRQNLEQAKRTQVAIVAVIISLLVALALGWGWYNTRHITGRGWRGQGWGGLAGKGLVLLLVLAFFALPILREPAEPATVTTVQAQALQTDLDTSQRAAVTADRTLGRAWMLGQVGAVWHSLDAEKGHVILSEALAATGQAEMNRPALWGQAATAQEAAVADPAFLEKAGLIANQLDAMRSRAWQLGLISQEWSAVDAESARAALDQGLKTAAQAQSLYRDLDLRKLAIQSAALDLEQASQIAAQIDDPALRAWTWREIAVQNGPPNGAAKAYEQTVSAARLIADPVRKAVALGRIAAQSGSPELFAEARQLIAGLNSEHVIYAWVTLATLSQDAALIEQIPAANPAARAAALIGVGQSKALEQPIDDPYELGRAQAQVVTTLAKSSPALAQEVVARMTLPLFRDRARRDLAIASGDATLVDAIQSPYLKIQVLTALGKYPEAAALAGQVKEAYPLVQLAVEWAKTDPQAALALVDQMPREADRSTALNAIAAQTKDPAIFERALGMALAARVRSDALSPARTSLELALAFLPGDPAKAQAALEQAYQAALSISIK